MKHVIIGAGPGGVVAAETLRKVNYDAKNNPREAIIRELGLDDLLYSVKPVTMTSGDLISIGCSFALCITPEKMFIPDFALSCSILSAMPTVCIVHMFSIPQKALPCKL